MHTEGTTDRRGAGAYTFVTNAPGRTVKAKERKQQRKNKDWSGLRVTHEGKSRIVGEIF